MGKTSGVVSSYLNDAAQRREGAWARELRLYLNKEKFEIQWSQGLTFDDKYSIMVNIQQRTNEREA